MKRNDIQKILNNINIDEQEAKTLITDILNLHHSSVDNFKSEIEDLKTQSTELINLKSKLGDKSIEDFTKEIDDLKSELVNKDKNFDIQNKINTLFSSKKFINDVTKKHYENELKSKLLEDEKADAETLLKTLTSNEKGEVLENIFIADNKGVEAKSKIFFSERTESTTQAKNLDAQINDSIRSNLK